ncbi:MAG: hypothetical protein ABJF04_10215 [Reichenbachiella sp.]|uniref:hypothetical protein n=1 Tax=Reichenbachiella sp. TaxID=2184521 RepID=UPI003264CBCA
MMLQKTKLTTLIGIFLFSFNSLAQSPWLNNNKPGFVAFEFSKVSLKGDSDLGFLTGTYDLSGGFSIGEKSELIVDLPIAHFKATDDFFGSVSETTIGNLYLGLRTGDRSKRIRGEFGVYLPTTADDKLFASSIGAFSVPNREEKFFINVWGLAARAIAEKSINDAGAYYRFRGGLVYLRDSDAELSALYLDYSGQIGVRTENGIGILAGISGRTGIGDDSKYAEDDSSSFLFALGLSYRTRNFEPGLTLNLPLDEPYKQLINNVINVSLLFHLGE